MSGGKKEEEEEDGQWYHFYLSSFVSLENGISGS